MSTINTQKFGKAGADVFQMLTINSIGMHGGSYVDQITINGQTHGGSGGAESPTITLAQGEYVNHIEVYAEPEVYVNYLKFTTNLNQSIEGGTKSGVQTKLSDIKLIGIVGYSGSYLNQVEFIYEG